MATGTAEGAPPRVSPVITRLRAVRDGLTAWLARPLSSFHLILAITGLLTVFGLVMVLSASSTMPDETYSVFQRQVVYVVVGLVLFVVMLRIRPRTLRTLSFVFLVISVLLLVAVLIPDLGTWRNGARSWFVIGSLSFQPVEPAKLALALWGAHVLVTKRGMLSQWRHLLVPVGPVALAMFALLMLQPDLGSTITLGVVLIALLWFAGAPLRLFAMIVAGALTGAITLALVASYRMERVTSFLNPEEASNSAEGYQALQALYALASGGAFGKGLGQSGAKWRYLPNVHNDFIFAVIGEELGLIGAVLVLALFGTLAYVGLRIATRNTDPWLRMVSATLTVWIVGQAALNVAYVVGLLPVTGLTLPLISSGGTSVITTMITLGLLANIARHEPEAVAALRNQGPGRVGRVLRLPAPEPYRPVGRPRPARPSTPPSTPSRSGARTAATSAPGGERRRGDPTRGETTRGEQARRRWRGEGGDR